MIDIGKVKEIFSKKGANSRHSFVIVTDDKDYHERLAQPCFGELRKYEVTHPGECTQPQNNKPGDLYYPFPEGKPTGLAVYTYQWYPKGQDLKFLFSNESPWKKGFVDEQYVEHHDNFIVLNNPDFDPTVLVNLMKFCNSISFRELPGLSRLESIGAMIASHGNPLTKYANGYAYSTPAKVSFKRILNKNPIDWTGGIWSDRVDYNRTRMQDVFLSSEPNDFCHQRDFKTFAGSHQTGLFTLPEAGKIWRNIIDHYMTNESDPVDQPYYWTTTSGKTNKV